MMHLLCAGMTLVLVLLGFHNAYCISGVHSAYLGLYKGVVEEAVVVVNDSGQYLGSPQFHIPYLRKLLSDDYAVNLAPYCRNYTYDVLRYDGPGGELTIETSRHIELRFTAIINDFHTINKSARFQLWRTNNG